MALPSHSADLTVAEERKPWEQLEDEPKLWFVRFERYRRLPGARSVLAAWRSEMVERGDTRKRTTREVPGAWRRAAERWHWRARADAFDQHLVDESNQVWEQRREQLRQDEWQMRQQLIDKAKQMLVFPLATTKREEKDVNGMVVSVTTILPARWTFRDAAVLLELADKLGRLSAEMSQGKVEIADWKAEAERAGVTNVSAIFNELVNKIRQQMDGSHDAGGADRGAPAIGSGTPAESEAGDLAGPSHGWPER